MRIPFVKMEGCGNDYIYFDCMSRDFRPRIAEIARLCDRHKGIGGDGVVLIARGVREAARMIMFNADGSEGAMCGNAIRCVAYYLRSRGYVATDRFRVETASGDKDLAVLEISGRSAVVSVGMGEARGVAEDLLEVGGKIYAVTKVSMGNPHCVTFVPDPEAIDLGRIGPLFENHPAFPDRTNAEFVRVTGDNALEMRVWERGSGETMACGTGACAAAVAAVKSGRAEAGRPVEIRMRGGALTVTASRTIVVLTGAANEVFEGETEL